MTTQQLAERLVALCREGQHETAQKELYADNAISIEPHEMAGFDKETKGLPAILEKGRKFAAMVEEMHSSAVSDPIVAGNSFAMTMSIDATMGGKRSSSTELCVYKVKDGKIISEEFFI